MRIKKEDIKSRKGFTLVELLIGSALVSFVILGIVALYSFEFNLFSANVRDCQLQNEANIAIEHITKHIRRKGDIDAVPPAVVTEDSPVVGSDHLQVKWKEDIIPLGCQYQLVGDELTYYDTYDMQVWTSSEVVVKNVSQLNFSYDPDKKIAGISTILSKDGKSFSVSSQVRL